MTPDLRQRVIALLEEIADADPAGYVLGDLHDQIAACLKELRKP